MGAPAQCFSVGAVCGLPLQSAASLRTDLCTAAITGFKYVRSFGPHAASASLAQLVEHALRKRMVVGSTPHTGGSLAAVGLGHLNCAHAALADPTQPNSNNCAARRDGANRRLLRAPLPPGMGMGPWLDPNSSVPEHTSGCTYAPINKTPCRVASLAQLVEHAPRKRMVVGSIPTGGLTCSSRLGAS